MSESITCIIGTPHDIGKIERFGVMQSDDERATELMLALRASWPRRESLKTFADVYNLELTQAFGKLTQDVPNHELNSFDVVLDEIAISLANGFLAEQTKDRTTGESPERTNDRNMSKFSEMIQRAATHGSLSDVLLAAACARRDDACNRRLLELLNKNVAQRLTAAWGPGKATSVIDDLPSHLQEPLKRGFNRGRARLLDFYGRSSLQSWLETVARHIVIDRARANREEPVDGNIFADRPGETRDSDEARLLQIISELAPRVAAELVESLSDTSPEQYHVAILRLKCGYTNKQIADRLGKTEPAVSQLLKTVCRKFLELLVASDPCFSDVTGKVSGKSKRLIEEAIFALFQAEVDSNKHPGDDSDAE